tara:strand:+ start:3779 stop:4186 length:408 start_codon:yes stop_codon:yes gene_type:complete
MLQHADIRELWDVIRPGLESIREDSKAEWRVEDVYASCVHGDSFLLWDHTRKNSFCIVKTVGIPFSRGNRFLVWIGFDPGPDSLMTYHDELEEMARETGHQQMEIGTHRPGLVRLSKKYGYEEAYTVLVKDLESK